MGVGVREIQDIRISCASAFGIGGSMEFKAFPSSMAGSKNGQSGVTEQICAFHQRSTYLQDDCVAGKLGLAH